MLLVQLGVLHLLDHSELAVAGKQLVVVVVKAVEPVVQVLQVFICQLRVLAVLMAQTLIQTPPVHMA